MATPFQNGRVVSLLCGFRSQDHPRGVLEYHQVTDVRIQVIRPVESSSITPAPARRGNEQELSLCDVRLLATNFLRQCDSRLEPFVNRGAQPGVHQWQGTRILQYCSRVSVHNLKEL